MNILTMKVLSKRFSKMYNKIVDSKDNELKDKYLDYLFVLSYMCFEADATFSRRTRDMLDSLSCKIKQELKERGIK